MLIGGKSFSEVDWQSVKVSTLEGAIATATVGVSLAVTAGREGLKLTGKQIAKQAGKTMVIHGSSGMAINATSQAVVKGEVNASEVILSGAIDSVTGGFGRVLPHTGLGKAVKTFGDNVAEKAKGFTRGAFDNTRLVLGNERGSIGGTVGRNVGEGVGEVKLLQAPQGSNPWIDGGEIISMKAPKNFKINMAMAENQTRPGGWGTLDRIFDVDYVRNNLAVTPEFKPDVSKVQQYLVPEGTRIQIGKVGAQTYNGKKYPGGGSQIQILNYSDREKLIPLGDCINIK
ncbi:MAG: hypothetical protein PHD60_11675 [Clostridia bacterium]|nr:hypothetical protein [Clostridia bacterium]